MPEQQQQQQEVTSFKARTHHGSGQKETYNLKASKRKEVRWFFHVFPAAAAAAAAAVERIYRFSTPDLVNNIRPVLYLYQNLKRVLYFRSQYAFLCKIIFAIFAWEPFRCCANMTSRITNHKKESSPPQPRHRRHHWACPAQTESGTYKQYIGPIVPLSVGPPRPLAVPTTHANRKTMISGRPILLFLHAVAVAVRISEPFFSLFLPPLLLSDVFPSTRQNVEMNPPPPPPL